MIISRTSQYAIQALIYIATQGQNKPLLSREIAGQLHVPAAYLSKIMQTLSHGGLVMSFRGRMGGFCLREAPSKVDLMSILSMTEGPRFTQDCVLGLKICSEETACPMHHRWKPIKEEIIRMLRSQTLETLSNAVKSGRYRLSDIPQTLWAE